MMDNQMILGLPGAGKSRALKIYMAKSSYDDLDVRAKFFQIYFPTDPKVLI